MIQLFGLDPACYRHHCLHDADRTFVESNCYTDVLVELLHGRGDEPLAVLGPTVRVDFEGDQWTFFKPDPSDLSGLLGIDIHEMMPHRTLPEQLADQLARGRTLLVEVDAWHLPDTRGTSYRTEHVKTSVAIEAIDSATQRLRYFHGTSLHELAGPDFRALFPLAGRPAAMLPPYLELVSFDQAGRLRGAELRAAARLAFARHLSRRPAGNPFTHFGQALPADLDRLATASSQEYHAYAFATARMAGAAFEICQAHVEWLYGGDGAPASRALGNIVASSKLLVFKLARRRQFATEELISDLAENWDAAMSALDALRG